ncbi:MAG: MerR family transcriptional regulator [Pseudoclavibacter sp.]
MTDEVTTDGITVGDASDAAGVTVRTLHHWDAIGLVPPSLRSPSGFRLYTADDLDRLERVVAYRESGLGLEAIRSVLDDGGSPVVETLREQREQLAERIEDLQRLDARLERMTDAHERGILLTDEEQAEAFGDEWDPTGTPEARRMWGGTAQWAQFAERSAGRSKAEWRRLADGMRELQGRLVDAMGRGLEPGSPEANARAGEHRERISSFFTITREMQVCLARMFEEDPGFAAHYNGLAPGLATWFRCVVDEAARADGIEPETAIWR